MQNYGLLKKHNEMENKTFAKKMLSGEWLIGKIVQKNIKTFVMVIVAFIFFLFQQYRIEVLYFKTVTLKNELKLVRTKYVYTSVNLMNKTLESVVTEKLNENNSNLKIPKEPAQIIIIPAE